MKRLALFLALIPFTFVPRAAFSAAQIRPNELDYPCQPTGFSVDEQCHECIVKNVTLLLWNAGLCDALAGFGLNPCEVRIGVTFGHSNGWNGPCDVSVMMGDSADCGSSGFDISGCPTGPGNASMTMTCESCD